MLQQSKYIERHLDIDDIISEKFTEALSGLKEADRIKNTIFHTTK